MVASFRPSSAIRTSTDRRRVQVHAHDLRAVVRFHQGPPIVVDDVDTPSMNARDSYGEAGYWLWASPNNVSHRSQDGQVRFACSMHRIKRDRTIEGDKPAVVTGGQGQQVGVGHLTWTNQA